MHVLTLAASCMRLVPCQRWPGTWHCQLALAGTVGFDSLCVLLMLLYLRARVANFGLRR